MAGQLIYVVEYPFQSGDVRCPSLGERGLPLVPKGEEVLWQGHAVMRANWFNGKIWKQAWESPEPASIVLTDRRLAYAIHKFDKGSTYIGGLVIDTAIMTAVSKLRAANRRQGKVAAGQLVLLWAQCVYLFAEKGVMKRTQAIGAQCQVEDVPYNLIIEAGPSEATRLATLLATTAAAQRLALREDELPEEAKAELTAIVAAPTFSGGDKSKSVDLPQALKVGFDRP
jgi:hypothetical protein